MSPSTPGLRVSPHALQGIPMILGLWRERPRSPLPCQAVALFPITPMSLGTLPVPSLALGLLMLLVGGVAQVTVELWLCLWPPGCPSLR